MEGCELEPPEESARRVRNHIIWFFMSDRWTPPRVTVTKTEDGVCRARIEG